MIFEKGDLVIDTEPTRLQMDVIQTFLNDESYWAGDRTREQTVRAIEHSICFGLYHQGSMVGFGRVVSDRATFAYIGDVFIVQSYRGRGLSKWLMEVIVGHPELQGLRRWVLATKDAHGLYEQTGFSSLKHPERWMELAASGAY